MCTHFALFLYSCLYVLQLFHTEHFVGQIVYFEFVINWHFELGLTMWTEQCNKVSNLDRVYYWPASVNDWITCYPGQTGQWFLLTLSESAEWVTFQWDVFRDYIDLSQMERLGHFTLLTIFKNISVFFCCKKIEIKRYKCSQNHECNSIWVCLRWSSSQWFVCCSFRAVIFV